MTALRLKLFQETACYKKPLAFKVGETYPLPPYSTVKGMLHALIGATTFIPMRLSIQGTYDCIIVDYQSHYFVKKTDTNEIPLVFEGLASKPEYKNMTQMPLYTHMLYHVNLVIHVSAEDEILNRIIDAIENAPQHISIGRWEDLVRVDEYRLVDVFTVEDGEVELKYDAYVPLYLLTEETRCVPYRLNWKYEIKNGIRQWDKIKVGYVKAGIDLIGNELLVDDENYPVLYHVSEERG